MKIYIIQKITGYGGWGQTYYGDHIAIFDCKEKAEQYCIQNNFNLHESYPEVVIREEEIQ